MMMWSGGAFAQVRVFDIPSQDASHSIAEFAKQAGIEIFAPSEKLRGVHLPAIQGKHDVREALALLLAGSGLTVASDDGTLVTLRNKPIPAAAGFIKVAATSAVQVPQAAPVQSAATASVEEIVVTGSRVVRDGYESPTPVSVMGADQLNAISATNIADSVNRLPALSGSVSPHNSSHSVSSGTAGVNNLNLRALNPSRTLVLLDGQRVVGSQITGFNNNGGSPDVNAFPDELISRVDVVTGGASAAYGSDAVAGVVNFVLDHNFTGVKGEMQGGVTTYGDDRAYKIALTGGTDFAGGKGHFLISGNASYSQGVRFNPRPWNAQDWQIITNPAYGTNAAAGQSTSVPAYITRPDASLAVAMPGGIITTGPLKGTYFGPGGTPIKFNYGTLSGSTMMFGGDWQAARIDYINDLDIGLARQTFFTRASYNLTDDIEVFAQFQWAQAHSTLNSVPNFELGNITVKADNAFIPAALRAQLGATPSFIMGTTNQDIGTLDADNMRVFRRHVLGADGSLDAFGSDWKWNAYYQESTTHLSARAPQDLVTPQFMAATDAVFAPNGAIVCRSTLTNPGNGCVPYNLFGTGVNSQAAIAYVSATGFQSTSVGQDVMAFSMNGNPIEAWAGPVSLAFGAEHRYEGVYGINSPLDSANSFFAGNYHASLGHFDVNEGFVETVVPLAKDTAWARTMDLDLAARFTSYSTSGFVTTWKVGVNYQPFDDIRLRATRSRDIRAPNLGELFSAGASGTGNVTDPATGITTTIVAPTKGNPALQPEKADSSEIGIVVSPSFWPGFQASVDYYNIDISGAIAALNSQQTVNLCFTGNAALCSTIHRTNGLIDFININSQGTHGMDFEATYRTPLASIVSSWDGDFTLNGKATYVFSLRTVDTSGITQGAGVVSDGLSQPSAPTFRYTVSATLNVDPIQGVFTVRGLGSGKINNAFVVCTSSCPVSTTANPTIDNNHVKAVSYLDLALNYKLAMGDGEATLFLVTENLLNTAPPLIAGISAAAGGSGGGGYYAGQYNAFNYDRLGRMFRAGIRFKM
ncbi:MAG: TonB-dependent receptor plug domain-containing protein [Rhodospirillaceae bacterium]